MTRLVPSGLPAKLMVASFTAPCLGLLLVYGVLAQRGYAEGLLSVGVGALLCALLQALLIGWMAQRALRRTADQVAGAAGRVQHEQDFGARAERLEDGELGRLTDAFNALLSWREVRDRELDNYRVGVEARLAEQRCEVERKNRELRLILDSVDQGIVLIDRGGRPLAERSASFDRYFGAPEPGQSLGQIVARACSPFGPAFAERWQQLLLGLTPVEINAAQLPSYLETESGRSFELVYRAIGPDPEQFENMLVVVSDVTERVARARSVAELAQWTTLLERASDDPTDFLQFYRETDELVARASAVDVEDGPLLLRELGQLKDNFATFGLRSLAQLVGEIEADCRQRGGLPTEGDRRELGESWQRFAARARALLGESTHTVSVVRSSLQQLREAIAQRRAPAELAALAARLTHEPVLPKLSRMGDEARALALQLGRGPVQIELDADGVLAPRELAWLWQVLPEVIANSVDRGRGADLERDAAGNARPGRVRIAAIELPASFVIEIEDDGAPIDWERVGARARALGMPARTHEELVSALFAAGAPTHAEPADAPGRRLGLAAVEAACQLHGASIGVESSADRGTLFRVTVRSENDNITPGRVARTGALR